MRKNTKQDYGVQETSQLFYVVIQAVAWIQTFSLSWNPNSCTSVCFQFILEAFSPEDNAFFLFLFLFLFCFCFRLFPSGQFTLHPCMYTGMYIPKIVKKKKNVLLVHLKVQRLSKYTFNLVNNYKISLYKINAFPSVTILITDINN